MTLHGRDQYDCSSVLASWENEGGAPAPVSSAKRHSRYASDAIFSSFGRSVPAHWKELSHNFKQTVFQEIGAECDGPDVGLKERAARYLHENSNLQARDRKRELPERVDELLCTVQRAVLAEHTVPRDRKSPTEPTS